ncbi:class I SAM-dependent methyltransferase [Desulfovibrio caledoniensis]
MREFILGTAPIHHVEKAVAEIMASNPESRCHLFVKKDYFDRFRNADIPLHDLRKISVHNANLFYNILTLRPSTIHVVVGEHYFHSNVIATLRTWKKFLRLSFKTNIYHAAEPGNVAAKQAVDTYRAVHLDGSDAFFNVKLDISASYTEQDRWLGGVAKMPDRSTIFRDFLKLQWFKALHALNLHEALVANDLLGDWLTDFNDYWVGVLGCRPMRVTDFHFLLQHYRVKQRNADEYTLQTRCEHSNAWKDPCLLAQTFTLVYNNALNPLKFRAVCERINRHDRVLEFGCAMAPAYNTYRHFYQHKKANWVLSDIENFPFHYARHRFARDENVEAVHLIAPEHYEDPLHDLDGRFDMIIVLTVFEHLHSPLVTLKHLISKLKSGGLLVFDYIRSEAKGLDSVQGLEQRQDTLRHIRNHMILEEGDLAESVSSTSMCFARKP